MDLALCWRHLCGSREDAKRLWLRRASRTTVVEANVAVGLLVRLMYTGVVMVPIDGVIVAAPAVVLLTDLFLCIRATAARPVAEFDMAHWEEEGAAFGAAEEPMALVGPIACSFTNR